MSIRSDFCVITQFINMFSNLVHTCKWWLWSIQYSRHSLSCLPVKMIVIIFIKSTVSYNYIPRCGLGYIGFGLFASPQTTCERDYSKTNAKNFMKLCRSFDISMLMNPIFRWLCATIHVWLRGRARSNFSIFYKMFIFTHKE